MQISLREAIVQNARDEGLEKLQKSNPYNEEPYKDFHQLDALTQLKANVEKITDLQFRLNYMMGEVQSLVKKR
ncbi:MAG: hypothetical protein H6625_07070 [Bdellovibrionaceae bacterium]|nr:hypothetical protein [Pseudobdellovibrionaceae bacterium]